MNYLTIATSFVLVLVFIIDASEALSTQGEVCSQLSDCFRFNGPNSDKLSCVNGICECAGTGTATTVRNYRYFNDQCDLKVFNEYCYEGSETFKASCRPSLNIECGPNKICICKSGFVQNPADPTACKN